MTKEKNILCWYNTKTMVIKRFTITNLIFSIIVIGVIFSSLGFTSAIKINTYIEKIPIIFKANEEKFSISNIKDEIINLNLQHPDIIYAQCLIESGNFSSNIWKLNNNCLGMKLAKSRPTTAIGEANNHAIYKNYKDCLKDYAIWQSSYARNLTKNQYLQLLQEIYAEDKNYTNLIQEMMFKHKLNKPL